MSRPRDSQKQRLYDAERASGLQSSKWTQSGERLFGGRWTTEQPWTIEQCQRYVNELVESTWFRRRWTRQCIVVEPGRGGGHAGWYGIRLGVWARQEIVVLHEVAHLLTPASMASHGPEYAGVLLTLVGHKMGADARRALRESMREHGVKVSLSAVPKPTRDVTPTSVVRRRLAAASKLPVEPMNASAAAATIRRAVKAGQFGPSGRKPRAHALETARRLERLAQGQG